MAQFYFHYRDGVDVVMDHDGREFATIDAARGAAIKDFRSIVAADAAAGIIDLDAYIEIATRGGEVQSVVRVTEAFQIKMPGG